MKPISLTMQAFGPFAGTETINFADLGDAPLFLINGPTGSGKTTILDAICYALYGSTTGDEREAKEMRCQHSESGLLTEVSFDFSLGGESYRIIRSPDQYRPKLKGEGFTAHKTRATLYRLGTDGTVESGELLVEQKVTDATEQIKVLTGMQAEQFRQVMVLPQGQFRKLLMADSKEREKIFQALFQTGVYKRIEEQLREDSKELRIAHDRGKSVIRNILEQGGAQNEAQLMEKAAEAASELQQLTATRDASQAAWQKADHALRDARQLVADFEQRGKARAKQEELETVSAEMDVKREQAELARVAGRILPLYRNVHRLEVEQADARTTLQKTGKALTDAESSSQSAQESLESELARTDERSAASATINQLESYAGKAEQLGKAKTARDEALSDEKTAREAVGVCAAQLAELEGGDKPLKDALRRLETAVNAAIGIEVEVHKLQGILKNHSELAKVDMELADALRLYEQAGAELTARQAAQRQAEQDQKRLQQQWHQGQAVMLAEQLESGAPCPVCGSVEHPAPAAADYESVTDDMLETAALAVERESRGVLEATKRVTRLEGSNQALSARKSKLLAELAGYAELADEAIKLRLARATDAAEQLIDNRKSMQKSREALDLHGKKLAEQNVRVAAARETLGITRNKLGQATTRYDIAASALPEAYREPGKLDAAIKGAKAELATLDGQLQQATQALQDAEKACVKFGSERKHAKETLEKLTRQLSAAKADAADALAQSDFETGQEVERASMAENDLDALVGGIAEFDRQVLQVATQLETLEQKLAEKKPGDLAALEKAQVAAQSERDERVDAWNAANRTLGLLEQTRKNLDARNREMTDLEEKYRVVGTLADVACGNTGTKVSLQRYVLGVLLDDILVQATQRLMKMSAGRYELIRKRDPGKGNKASGLDLEVYDDYTGESRSVATLSGGESFMAALSLALGLSDVVQAQTGGIRLDTLFVDEGFGTLDSEALELAVSTLMDLQQAGRMVGVISHVSELKEQMDVRIDISKSQTGSSFSIVSPLAD